MAGDRIPAQYKELVEKIETLVTYWEPLFDLPGIEVQHRFLPTTADSDRDQVADTHVMWQYRRAQVRWWLGQAIALDPDSLELILIHEYVHILMGPLPPVKNDDLEELVTESLARAILKAHRG